MQLKDVLPTALVCAVEAAVVFGIDIASNRVVPLLGIGDAGPAYLSFLAIKLFFQFTLGAVTFFGLAYWFRLRPLGEYAQMASEVLGRRFSRIAERLAKRFDCHSINQ
jgi:hypothetical protein